MIMTYLAIASCIINLVCILIIKTQKMHIDRLKREQLPLEPIEPGTNDFGGMYYDVVHPDYRGLDPIIIDADYTPVEGRRW